MKSRLRLRPLLALAAILLVSTPAVAQYQQRYEDDGIRQSVARVSWFEGEVSFSRGDAPDDWQFAAINYPMTVGDRIWSAPGSRVELQVRGATVYLGPGTELATLDLARDVQQLSLNLGTASFQVNRLARDEVFEVATPNVSVTFETPGFYRIDVDEDGNSRVSVRRGQAWAAAAGGQVALESGDQIRVWGTDRPDYDVVGLPRPDSWDRWVDKRTRRYRSVRSVAYVHPEIYGAADLDAYGTWSVHAEFGSVWYPRGVPAGWEPYRSGRWIWRDPWGWTWLSSEPWGWAPYHYGRWALDRGRWCWVPVGPSAQYPGYAPAVVGFVGGGSGWSISISAGGFVGWFPLAPREPFDPWWYHARTTTNVTSYNYAYRSRVTVVSRDVFVQGRNVDRDLVRDTRIVQQVATAPVLRGPIPVVPTRESIRVSPVSVQGRATIQPPERISRREVVTRTAPPPPPPSFDRKLEVIRESGGQPVRTDESRRLSAEEHRGEKADQPVRPAARQEVLLEPRGNVKDSRKPQPLPPSANRPSTTPDRPVFGREQTPTTREPEPRRVETPATLPGRERVPAPEPEVKREAPPARGAPEARPEKAEKPEKPAKPEKREAPMPPERGVDRPAPTPTPMAERIPAPPPRAASPASPPSRERVPAPGPEVKRETPPTWPAPEAKPEKAERPGKPEQPGKPEKREAPRPPEPNVDRPAATPVPRVERFPAPPSPRVEPNQPAPRPDQAKPAQPGPEEKVAPRPPERGKGRDKGKPTPSPTPKDKEKGKPDSADEPGKRNDR